MVILGIPPETWFPVVTLITGVMLKAVFDMMTDRRTALREREARRDQRRDALRLKRVEFQRATLMSVLTELARLGYIGQQSVSLFTNLRDAYTAAVREGYVRLTAEEAQRFRGIAQALNWQLRHV